MVAPAVASLAATTAVLYGQESEPGTLDAAHEPALAQAALTALGGAPYPPPSRRVPASRPQHRE